MGISIIHKVAVSSSRLTSYSSKMEPKELRREGEKNFWSSYLAKTLEIAPQFSGVMLR